MTQRDKRTTIFECYTGSHLYGTNRATSDEDFKGVFIPSANDLLSLTSCLEELDMGKKLSDGARNSAGDVDRKHWSVQRFLQLVAQGQSAPIEMLFAGPAATTFENPLWTENKAAIIKAGVSRKALEPFVGFAMAQAHKSTVKGENLNKIRELLFRFRQTGPSGKVIECVSNPDTNKPNINGVPIEMFTNNFGHKLIKLAGRSFDVNSKVGDFIRALERLEGRYGGRTESAAAAGVDTKSLMHAYRMCIETDELMRTGKLTLPLPAEHVAFLLSVRDGQLNDVDHFLELDNRVNKLRSLVDYSDLPEKPDFEALNEICYRLLVDSVIPL